MQVASSNIAEINHDYGGLEVVFRNGRTYRYPTADSEVYAALATEAAKPSGSVGKLFNQLVRGVHEGHEVG